MKKISFDSPEEVEVEPKTGEKPRPEKTRKRWALKVFIGLGLLLIGIFVFLFFFLVTPVQDLRKDVLALQTEAGKMTSHFENQDFEAIFNQLKVVEDQWAVFKKDYQRLAWIRFAPYFRRYYFDGQALVLAGDHFLRAGDLAGQALMPYFDILGFGQEDGKTEKSEAMTVEQRLMLVLETLNKLEPQFDQITQELVSAQQEIEKINPEDYPQKLAGRELRPKLKELISIVDGTIQVTTEIKPIITYLEPLLGIPEEKVYFLLFQNDAELRPTGGFMTAYAFLSVHKGKFTPISSHDIFRLDEQFGNRIKAPEPIAKYLPNVDYWHLRDMNLSPDFVLSMETFWENYQKIPGARDVDGIIALDTQVLVDLLEVLGEIGVSGWGNFSAQNDPRCDCPQVFYELEKYADKPSSSLRADRKGIIGPLMHSILANAMGSPRKKWPEFVDVFFTSIQQKHLLFYFFDQDLQGAFEVLNAAGRIKDFQGDYFHLNDCNFAGAKSNMYIRENVFQQIEKKADGKLVKNVTVEYKNPAPPSNCNLEKGELCLNGFYRNWFRIYVPEGSKLIDFKGSEVEIETYDKLEKTVFEGFYGKTPGTSLKPEGKLTLEFSYELPFKAGDWQTLPVLVQKQPGALNHEYEIKFGNQVEKFVLDSDREIQLTISN